MRLAVRFRRPPPELSENPNGALVLRMSSGSICLPIGGADRAVHSARWHSRRVTPIGVAASGDSPGSSWV